MAPPMADNNIRLVLLNRRRLICIAAFASLFCSFGNLILIQTFSSRPQSTPDSCYRWPIEPLQAEPHIAHVLPGSSHRHLIIYSFSSFSLLLEKSFSIHFFLSWDPSTTIGQISTLSTWFKLKYFSIQLFENLVSRSIISSSSNKVYRWFAVCVKMKIMVIVLRYRSRCSLNEIFQTE